MTVKLTTTVGGATALPVLLEEFRSETVRVEELLASVMFTGVLSEEKGFPVVVAKFPLRIMAASVAISGPSGGVPLDESHYWIVSVTRKRNNVNATIAQKRTQNLTNGAAMPRGTDWNFDQAEFDPDNQQLEIGDVCSFDWAMGGTPVEPENMCMTVRYEPL